MQPPSGGFLEAVPWTSFLVMGLASTGRVNHPVARRGLGFLLDTVRGDASWSIDTKPFGLEHGTFDQRPGVGQRRRGRPGLSGLAAWAASAANWTR